MVAGCSGYGCKNRGDPKNEKKLSFHRFPKDPEARKKWIVATRRKDFNPGPNTVLCSEHFKSEDYYPKYASGLRKLRENAIPSIFNFPQHLRNQEEVCEKHFETHEVEWSSSMRDPKTGKVVTAPRLEHKKYRPRMKERAVPSLFPEVPVVLNLCGSVSSQEDAEDRMAHLEEDLEMTVDEQICRICGLEASNLISLFETQAIEMDLLRKIEDILSVKIEIGDNLPNEICEACISNLDSCEQFIKMARNSNLRLHKIYGERKELLEEATELIKCPYCDKEFRNSLELNRHVSIHSTAALHLCDLCGSAFKNAFRLECHKRTHLDETARKKHPCTQCDKKFRSRCSMCEKNSMSSNVLNQHMKDHLETPRFECPHCNKKLKSKGSLSVHLRIHSGQRPFSCGVCGRSFHQKNDMLRHVKHIHSDPTTNNPNFSCYNCSRTFNDVNELNEHKVIHETSDIVPETDDKNLIFINEI